MKQFVTTLNELNPSATIRQDERSSAIVVGSIEPSKLVLPEGFYFSKPDEITFFDSTIKVISVH